MKFFKIMFHNTMWQTFMPEKTKIQGNSGYKIPHPFKTPKNLKRIDSGFIPDIKVLCHSAHFDCFRSMAFPNEPSRWYSNTRMVTARLSTVGPNTNDQ